MALRGILPGQVLFLAAALAAVSAAAEEESWIGRFDGDVKTGFSRIVWSEVSEGGEKLARTDVTRSFAYFKGAEVAWTQFVTVIETAAGEVRSFSFSSTTSAGKTVYDGRVSGETARIFEKLPDSEPREYDAPWKAGCLGPAAWERKKRDAALAGTGSMTCEVFSLDYLKPVNLTVRMRGVKPVRSWKGTARLAEFKVELDMAGSAYYWEYRDGKGAFSHSATSDGQVIEAAMGKAEAEARQKGVLAIYPVSLCVQSPGIVVKPRQARASVIKLNLGGQSDFSRIHFAFDGQRVSAAEGAKSATISVTCPAAKAAAELPETDARFKPCLDPNYFLDFDPAGGPIAEAARRAAGSEKNSLKAARKMSEWISESFRKLPLNAGFAVASDTLSRMEGDSSELAVLLCAMARSHGVPSKLAGGFCLQGGYFVFHAWAEIWAGSWIPLDPSSPGGVSDAMRIKLGETDLSAAAPEYVFLAAGSIVKDLKVSSVAYQVGSAVLEASEDQPDAFHSSPGDAYANQLYGFGFSKPPSWSVSTNLRGITGGLVAVFGRNQQERVLVRPHMAEYSLDYDSLLRKMEVNYSLGDPREIEVDGRKAVVVKTSMKGGGYAPMTCYVLTDGVMYAIESNDCSDDCRAAFEYVLRSMKFRKQE